MSIKIEKLNREEIEKRRVENWPIWEKEVSSFPWFYDSDEQCYILEGEVFITEDHSGTKHHIKAGDFVTFKSGLSCHWDIKQPIKKHYNFI